MPARKSRIEAVVHHLKAQIEVGDRRPYGARADLGIIPVGRATKQSTGRQDGRTGGIAIIQLAISTVERGLPLGDPEVLVTGGDAPGCRQVETAVHENGVNGRTDIVDRAIRVRQIEPTIRVRGGVGDDALAVGELRNHVVTMAQHRSVELQTRTECPAGGVCRRLSGVGVR